MELSLLPREEKVTIDGKVYTLREITEAASIDERREMARGVVFDTDGKPKTIPDALPENESFVVSRCLFDDAGTPVAIATIKTWPRRVVRALFDICAKLNEVEKTEPKNSPSATTDTSA